MMKQNTTATPLVAHLSMLLACVFWGLMSPLAKDAMAHGVHPIAMVSFRVAGGALLFWLASLAAPREHVPLRHKLLFMPAALCGLVCNQCGFTIGLGFTSPVNASIVTTSMPIFSMVLATLLLHEPLTGKKALGVMLGCCGAVILILTSASAQNARVGDLRGDLMVLGAQFSYALFLTLFNRFVRSYSVFTVNKWMFLWATLLIWPFSLPRVVGLPWQHIALTTWMETAYVVVFGTFICYILIIIAQQVLRPTVVASYNYAQPVLAVIVSVAMGLSIFRPEQALAVVLVFSGVWLVTRSRARVDQEHKG